MHRHFISKKMFFSCSKHYINDFERGLLQKWSSPSELETCWHFVLYSIKFPRIITMRIRCPWDTMINNEIKVSKNWTNLLRCV